MIVSSLTIYRVAAFKLALYLQHRVAINCLKVLRAVQVPSLHNSHGFKASDQMQILVTGSGYRDKLIPVLQDAFERLTHRR